MLYKFIVKFALSFDGRNGFYNCEFLCLELLLEKNVIILYHIFQVFCNYFSHMCSIKIIICFIDYSNPLVILGGLVPELSLDTKILGCSSPLYKMMQYLHITYTHTSWSSLRPRFPPFLLSFLPLSPLISSLPPSRPPYLLSSFLPASFLSFLPSLELIYNIICFSCIT